MNYYILDNDGKTPVRTEYFEWMKYFYYQSRYIAFDRVWDTFVSTIFYGVDPGSQGGYPLLFETKVFGKKVKKLRYRYATYEEALEGHRLMIYRLTNNPSEIELKD